jgi:hypothetical protein
MMRRRAFLGGVGAGVGMLKEGFAAPPMVIADQVSPTPNDYSILVCGPRGGGIDRWGLAVAQGLRGGLSPHRPIQLHPVGGQDGVTGANRLQTVVVPDGRTAAMVPSDAAIAFLTGDTRVHFQLGDWISVLAGLSPAVVVVRGGLARLTDAAPIRLAAASPESQDLAALLAFQRLGVKTSPIFGLRGAPAVARAFAAGEADAALLTGEDVPADAASLLAEGGIAIGTLGVVDDRDRVAIDPLLTALPTIHSIAGQRGAAPLSPPLERAYRAVAAASRIDFMMVLPHLTIPATVAVWRQAAAGAIGSEALQAAAAASAVNLTVTGAAAAAAPLDVQADSLLALRQFLDQHFGWHPS